jgi:hypothetical protein
MDTLEEFIAMRDELHQQADLNDMQEEMHLATKVMKNEIIEISDTMDILA